MLLVSQCRNHVAYGVEIIGLNIRLVHLPEDIVKLTLVTKRYDRQQIIEVVEDDDVLI